MMSYRPLHAGLSVNDTIREFPATLAILNEFGIDTCCGGAESLADAARSAEVDIDSLMARLTTAVDCALARAEEAGR